MQPQLIAGRYRVVRAIGRGGMGTVWLCRDEILGREVAVKQIGAIPGESATETKRAMREARSAAALNHPNAVAVYDVVDHESRPWLVMEYVEGQTLADEISLDGQLSPHRVADIGAQLAGALARAHERQIVHRDIKPGNVLIDKAGRPKISDFGIARRHGDEQLTQVGFITGTPGYLSPELARGGDPHPASDVWALGATLYTAVEGQPPYEPQSNPIALLRVIATERPRSTAKAGPLGPAIAAMMHEDPACRWDMATCARRLGAIARTGAPAVPRHVDPTVTRVFPAPVVASTQAVEPTRRLTPDPPAVAAATTRPPVSTQPVSGAPVTQPSGAPEPAATQPVARPPVVQPPVAQPTVAGQPASSTPVVAKPPPAVVPVVARHEPEPPGDRDGGGLRPPPHDSGSGRRSKPVLLGILLVAVLGVVFLLSQLGDQSNTIAGPVATRSTAPAAPATEPQASEQPSATTPEPSMTTVVRTPDADKKLESFVTSYYSSVTRNRDTTWAQLSPTMQAAAGGRSGYDGFWRTIRQVRVNRVQADASANTAVVSLAYTMTNGATSTETGKLTFLKDGEGYLIQSDR